MKTINSGSKWLSILLVVCLSSRLYAQSINVTGSLDSARAEFVANAKRINADLIKGDFAKEREEGYKATIAEKDKEIGGVTLELGESRAQTKSVSETLETTSAELVKEKAKRRAKALEVWFWRGLAVVTIYAKLKGL